MKIRQESLGIEIPINFLFTASDDNENSP